ncbi:MAG TPA: dihydropteroate synthase [Hyphomicrobium sp.]|nr:dihydropteroate synthase [Hyphomicrobium sp.]
MPRRFYLRPIIALATQCDRLDPKYARLHRLCGRGDIGFTHVELIDRANKGAGRCRLVGSLDAGAWQDRDWQERKWGQPPFEGEQIGSTYAALVRARAPISGLSMERPRIMGILNVTPDSFSDGGRHANTKAAVAHGLRLLEEGADILDIGGESTRPGSDAVALKEELARVIPVIEGLRAKTRAVISIDTRKAEVMRQAAAAGAGIINDVSALTHDPMALDTAVASGLPVMLMHAQGDPKSMNDNPQYDDVVLDVYDYLARRIGECVEAGIPSDKIIVDPGIGFGKHLHHNVAVMQKLSLYHGLGVALLLGASRKKMIGQLCDVPHASDRVPGSLAAALCGVAQGVQIVRVHDVAETRQAVEIWRASLAGTEAGLDV